MSLIEAKYDFRFFGEVRTNLLYLQIISFYVLPVDLFTKSGEKEFQKDILYPLGVKQFRNIFKTSSMSVQHFLAMVGISSSPYMFFEGFYIPWLNRGKKLHIAEWSNNFSLQILIMSEFIDCYQNLMDLTIKGAFCKNKTENFKNTQFIFVLW